MNYFPSEVFNRILEESNQIIDTERKFTKPTIRDYNEYLDSINLYKGLVDFNRKPSIYNSNNSNNSNDNRLVSTQNINGLAKYI